MRLILKIKNSDFQIGSSVTYKHSQFGINQATNITIEGSNFLFEVISGKSLIRTLVKQFVKIESNVKIE